MVTSAYDKTKSVYYNNRIITMINNRGIVHDKLDCREKEEKG